MFDSTLTGVVVGAAAASLPAYIAGRHQLLAIERQATIESRERRTDVYEGSLAVLSDGGAVALAMGASLARGANLPYTSEAYDLLRQALIRLVLRGTDDVYRAAMRAIDELTAADARYHKLGEGVRGEVLFEVRQHQAAAIGIANKPDQLFAAISVLMGAMRDDAARGAVVAPRRRWFGRR